MMVLSKRWDVIDIPTFLRRNISAPIKENAKRYIGLIPAGRRLGRHYKATQKFLRLAQWWNTEQIKAWQLQKLQETILYAYENVPGYYYLYNSAGVRPETIRSLDDVKALPFVTKELIRDNLSEFTSPAVPRREQVYTSTGGSTGVPFGFFQTARNRQIELAFMHLGWQRAGWNLGKISAELRGRFVGSEADFWKYDNYDRTLLLSSYYLSEHTYERYVDQIHAYRPQYLKAYPSAATILADLVLAKKQVGSIDFQIILLGSENIYDWQKAKLLEAFPSAKLFGWYGHAEQVILAAMCERSDQYHVWPFYGFTELCDEAGREVEVGAKGELVGTSFWNYATPFIRYRTKDLATKGNSYCDQCHRQFQLLENLEGRLQEMVVSRTGRYISMTAINMHSDVFEHVKQFQFQQRVRGELRFVIVPKREYSELDTKRIYHDLSQKLGSDMDLEIDFAEEIAKRANGKARFLMQELQLNYGE
jgi:phenylacetate-CoA ligase